MPVPIDVIGFFGILLGFPKRSLLCPPFRDTWLRAAFPPRLPPPRSPGSAGAALTGWTGCKMNVWIHALPSPPPAHTKPDLSNKNPLESTWGEKEEEKRGRNPGESEVGRGKIHGKAGKALQEVVLALRKSHFFPPCSTWIFWILPGPAQNPGKTSVLGASPNARSASRWGRNFGRMRSQESFPLPRPGKGDLGFRGEIGAGANGGKTTARPGKTTPLHLVRLLKPSLKKQNPA